MAGPNLPLTLPPVPPLTKQGFQAPVWTQWLNTLRSKVIATVTSVQIATANGFNGSAVDSGNGLITITLGVTVVGVLKGSAGALVPAVAGTDFLNSVTLIGDASGTTNTSQQLPVTLASTGVTAGTYGGANGSALFTVDAKGRLTAASTVHPAIPTGPTASRPSGVVDGTMYLDTSLGLPIWKLASAATGWIAASGFAV